MALCINTLVKTMNKDSCGPKIPFYSDVWDAI